MKFVLTCELKFAFTCDLCVLIFEMVGKSRLACMGHNG